MITVEHSRHNIYQIKKKSDNLKLDDFNFVISGPGEGKLKFKDEDLFENLKALYEAIQKNKPDAIKGSFIKKITIASTMGYGLEINLGDLN